MANDPIAVLGTIVSFSAANPATLDQPGYEAVTLTDETPCLITNVGSMGGTWDTKEDDTLCEDAKAPVKVKKKNNNFDLAMKYQKNDAVQTILKDNFNDITNALISIKIALNGDATNVKYGQVKATTYDPAGGGSGDDYTLSVSLVRDGEWFEVTA